jgi:uncharacterized protein (DUF362 family)
MGAPAERFPPLTRRAFLLGAGAAFGAGSVLAWQRWMGRPLAGIAPQDLSPFTGRTPEIEHPSFAMPGRFPGRVVEVHHPASVTRGYEIRPGAVKAMISQGMVALTGADHPQEAWASFFEPGDVVGIKMNPVGHSRRPGQVGAISSPAVLLEVVENLKRVGVKARDIIVLDRYADDFRNAGYEKVMREPGMDGTRWYVSGTGYDPGQLDIEGYDSRTRQRDRDPHVVGYDPDVFVSMGFAEPGYDNDERRFRSHLSVIVTRMINKMVTIPVLKDHRSAGVTMALKNLSHGLNNNVARSHIAGVQRLGKERSDPNQCNTFIPTAASQPLIRQKATLHIMDGLIGVYEGGPGSWNPSWGVWPHRSLFFATDPVAMDHVGWEIIDAKRAQEGWQPVARMGLAHQSRSESLCRRLAPLSSRTPGDALALWAVSQYLPGDQGAEQFDRRQPEHIILAATIGLGVFDARKIEHRKIRLEAEG